MQPHPLIPELARQSEFELQRTIATRRRAESAQAANDELTPIARAAMRGDEDAWKTLVRDLTPLLRGIVRGYRLSASDTEEVVQTAWVSAFTHIGSLREPEAIAGWLCVIARRAALRMLEHSRHELLVEAPSVPDKDPQTAPEEALVKAEHREAVHAAIDRLPDRHRTLIRTLLDQDGTSYAEIARRLALPTGSLGPTRERALKRLRRDRGLAGLFAARG